MASKKLPKVRVTRKWMNDLARSIYDSKNRRFLRLCDGTLQNGPDPTNKKRPMHCGLGELYFAMTGLQPEQTGVDEDGVVQLCIDLSPFGGVRDRAVSKAIAGVKALKLPTDLEETLLNEIESADDDGNDDKENFSQFNPECLEFRSILDGIPTDNDDGCGDDEEEGCSIATFRERSKRVAEKLRAAAKLLPE